MQAKRLVEMALLEDNPWGDVTTNTLIPKDDATLAHLTAKSKSIACGHDFFKLAFSLVDPATKFEEFYPEGSRVNPGDIVITVEGDTQSILTAERVALNFFCHMSGIATFTRNIVTLLEGTDTVIADTRKTLPLLRLAQKHAVRVGGGTNHRMDLSSHVLIKDNHIAACGGVWGAVTRAKESVSHVIKVEVEVKNLDQVREAVDAGADILLLDNMTPAQIANVVEIIPENVITEASGGIDLSNVRDYADAGVDVISMGCLTHSVKNADFSLEFEGSL